MKAVILAGGMGTRLHPLTVDIPKPMVPIANRPLIQYTVELLAAHGFNEVSMLLYHQPQVIKNYFNDGREFGMKIQYHEAKEDYGTAGAVKFAWQEAQKLKEPLLIISADLLTDIDLTSVVAFHKKKKAFATLVLTRVKDPIPYGIVITDGEGRITKYLEKPSWGEVFSDSINAGIYVIEPEVLGFIPPDKPFDFSLDLFPLLLEKKKEVFGFVAEGFWKDIGQLEDYRKAHRDVLGGNIKCKVCGKKISDKDMYTGENVVIAPSALLEGHVLIGDGSVISEKAVISDTVVGRNCRIGKGAALSDSVLWDGVEVGARAKIREGIIGEEAKVGPGAFLGEGVAVGSQAEIGANAEIKPFIKIWPRKFIEGGATVSRSVIWREHWRKSIFGSYGVTGLCNVEITPQFASALGAAYGTILQKGARISCSRDSHKASRMIYRALISGVLSSGVNISNLEMVPIPVNRYEIRSLKSRGGFHVRKSPFDAEVMDIKFFDDDGLDISPALEKKIERIFFAEDFTRTNTEETGELTYPFHRVAEEYKAGIVDFLNLSAISSSPIKVVIDYAFGSASQFFPSIFGELGVEAVSLDAYIDETKITKDRATFEKSLQQMTSIVKSVGSDVGIMLDTGAEKIILSDENGNIIESGKALGLMALMALRTKKNACIGVPVKESRVIEELARKYSGTVVRTKNSLRGMMEVAADRKICFLGEGLGGYIFPEFLPAFDAMLSACKLIEYLAREKVKLSELIAEVPRINLARIEIPCPAEKKGQIMRKSMDMLRGIDKLETIDGLKFWQGNDWVLVLPDSTRPVIHLYAEADSSENTRRLLSQYTDMINRMKED